MRHRIHVTPAGMYVIVVDDAGAVTGVYRAGQAHLPPESAWGERDDEAAADAVAQLDEYFAGTRTEFSLPLAPHGTDFQKDVWAALARIPYGQTRTYGEVAAALGRPGSNRAVGAAVGRNPLSIVVPCHRVMGAAGAMTGYAGGVETKALLLDLERRPGGDVAADGTRAAIPQTGSGSPRVPTEGTAQ